MQLQIKRKIETVLSPDELFEMILDERGITDFDAFLQPKHPFEVPLSEFFDDKEAFQKDWKRTVKLLKKIHEDKGSVVVYTDYDADGVSGGSIVWETFHKLGFKAMPYIPDRKTEGYGFSKQGLDSVKVEFHPDVIVSVDHGIVAHEQIAYAKNELKIPIIVTDHHQKQGGNPKEAFAVFHTSQVSGSGVGYFFAKELAREFGFPNGTEKLFKEDYVALASIGIIADLIPLIGHARAIAKYGLESLSKTTRIGLNNMLKEAGINNKKLSSYDVGFVIGPRINAFGRLEHALDALRLLCTTSYKRAIELSQKAGDINQQRQDLVKTAVDQARKQVNPEDMIVIVRNDEWEEGIIGLIASRLLNETYRPVIAISGDGKTSKGSARSIEGFDITAFLSELRDYLIDMGGHTAAAGFSIENENIEEFASEARSLASMKIDDEMLVRTMSVDMFLPLESLTMDLAVLLDKLEPYGIGNEKPLFAIEAELQDVSYMGAGKNHSKLLLKDGDHNEEVVIFNEVVDQKLKGKMLSVVLQLSTREWNGRVYKNVIGKWYKGN